MARTDTLTNFLTDVAESIRTKEGTTEQIAASEFDTRIANLPSGGSGEYNAKMSNIATPSGNEEEGYWFDVTTLIQELPNDLDISDINDFSVNLSNLTKLPDNLSTSHLTIFNISGCSSLTSIPQLDLSGLGDISAIFENCTSLVDMPALDFSNVTISQTEEINTFSNCTSLSDESLNNVMATLNTLSFNSMAAAYGKKLSVFGLSEEQANKCITLSNWSTLENDGWTTGY